MISPGDEEPRGTSRRRSQRHLRPAPGRGRAASSSRTSRPTRGIIGALPPVEHLIDSATKEIDTIAATWRDAQAAPLARAIGGRIDLDARGQFRGVIPGGLLAGMPGMIEFTTLCGLVPEVVKTNVAAILRAAQYEPGPAMSDRPKLIEATDARIVAVREQHAELVDHAAEHGIAIEHLPEERARRMQAEQRAGYDAANEALNASARRGAIR